MMLLPWRRQAPPATTSLAELAINAIVSSSEGKAVMRASDIEHHRLADALQRQARILMLTDRATMLADAASGSLFSAQAGVKELVGEVPLCMFIEYGYRPALRARSLRQKLNKDYLAKAPERMGVLLQSRGPEIYAGLICSHGNKVQLPLAMVDITWLPMRDKDPFWHNGVEAPGIFLTHEGQRQRDESDNPFAFMSAMVTEIYQELPVILAASGLSRQDDVLCSSLLDPSDPQGPSIVDWTAPAKANPYAGGFYRLNSGELTYVPSLREFKQAILPHAETRQKAKRHKRQQKPGHKWWRIHA